MRLKFKKGKQSELILQAKEGLTWRQLSKLLNINSHYLSQELKNEKRLLSNASYKELCSITGRNFDQFIIEKLNDNWGKSKGGTLSEGSIKKLNCPLKNEKLAELIGAILGDGNITFYKKGKKIGVYQIRIAGDYERDRDYHSRYLKNLADKTINIKPKVVLFLKNNERFLVFYSKELVEFMINMGLKPGNKIKNQLSIPDWILDKDSYLKACLRGLIDTDGCIHKMSKKDPNLLRINFTNFNKKLLSDVRGSLIKLGFNPSKITGNRIYLSKKKDICSVRY